MLRRTKPLLHPSKIPGYIPTSSTGIFLFKIKHFFIEAEHVAESYPYDRGVTHSKGWMIPYFEYRGLGAPPNNFGIPGDIWLDGTSQVAALYVRLGHGWSQLKAWHLVNQVFIPHPLVPERMLWCTRKVVVWCDRKMALRHWTTMWKGLDSSVGQQLLGALLDNILSIDPEVEGFVDPRFAARQNQDHRTSVASSEPVPTSLFGESNLPTPTRSNIGTDPADRYVPGSDIRPLVAITANNPVDEITNDTSPAGVSVNPKSSPSSNDALSAIIRSGTIDPVIERRSDPKILSATDDQIQESSLCCTTAFDLPDHQQAIDSPQFATSVTKPQARTAAMCGQSNNTSSATEFLHQLTVEAISRRHHDLTSTILSRNVSIEDNIPAEFSQLHNDTISEFDNLSPSNSGPDGEAQKLHSSQSNATQSDSAISPDHSLSSSSVPAHDRLTNSSLLGPVEKIFQASNRSKSMETAPFNVTLVHPEGEGSHLAEQQAQIQQLLREVRLLQSEVSSLREENRKLLEGNARVMNEHVDNIAACSKAEQLPLEIQEIVGPAIDSLKHGISLLAAKYQAERAAHLGVKQQLEKIQNCSNQPSSTEIMDTGLNNEIVEVTTTDSSDVSSYSKPPAEEISASAAEVEASKPGQLLSVAELAPLPSQPEIDNAPPPTLAVPSFPIRSKPSGRGPGFAIALRRIKAIRKPSNPNEGNKSVTRPAKRPRVSCDTVYPETSHDSEATTNHETVESEKQSSDSAQSPTCQIGTQHLRVLYLSHRDLEYCRGCLVRQCQDSDFPPVSFPSNTEAGVLIDHCKSEHPVACKKLVDKSVDELISIREQLESADPQLLDSMEIDEEE